MMRRTSKGRLIGRNRKEAKDVNFRAIAFAWGGRA